MGATTADLAVALAPCATSRRRQAGASPNRLLIAKGSRLGVGQATRLVVVVVVVVVHVPSGGSKNSR